MLEEFLQGIIIALGFSFDLFSLVLFQVDGGMHQPFHHWCSSPSLSIQTQ